MGHNDIEHGMHVVHDGSRQTPPLLLIHGSGASGARPVAALLDDLGLRNVSWPDIPAADGSQRRSRDSGRSDFVATR